MPFCSLSTTNKSKMERLAGNSYFSYLIDNSSCHLSVHFNIHDSEILSSLWSQGSHKKHQTTQAIAKTNCIVHKLTARHHWKGQHIYNSLEMETSNSSLDRALHIQARIFDIIRKTAKDKNKHKPSHKSFGLQWWSWLQIW